LAAVERLAGAAVPCVVIVASGTLPVSLVGGRGRHAQGHKNEGA
jgi:hypothetical protein